MSSEFIGNAMQTHAGCLGFQFCTIEERDPMAAVSSGTVKHAGECGVKQTTMTIGELVATVETMGPDHDVFVALFQPDGTAEVFDIDAVQDHHGDAQLDISEEEAADAQVDGRAARHACRRRR
jgi:hypothetical protein